MSTPSMEIPHFAECIELLRARRGMDRTAAPLLTSPDTAGIVQLDLRRALSGVPVGRIAITVSALPVVLPVNFAVIGGNIFFRTDRGTKLAAATPRAVVAFEVDPYEADGRSGWSVMAQGMAHEVIEPPTLEKVHNGEIQAWTVGGQTEHVVSGCRPQSKTRPKARSHRWPPDFTWATRDRQR